MGRDDFNVDYTGTNEHHKQVNLEKGGKADERSLEHGSSREETGGS